MIWSTESGRFISNVLGKHLPELHDKINTIIHQLGIIVLRLEVEKIRKVPAKILLFYSMHIFI